MEEKGEVKIQILYLRQGFRTKKCYYLKLLEEKKMKTGIGICQYEAGNTVGETKIAQLALL